MGQKAVTDLSPCATQFLNFCVDLRTQVPKLDSHGTNDEAHSSDWLGMAIHIASELVLTPEKNTSSITNSPETSQDKTRI